MADDTTIFTSNHQDVGKITRLLKAFYKISGLKTNMEKTIAYLLGPMLPPKKNQPDFGLSWKNLPINLLGITITNDEDLSCQENFTNRIKSISTLIGIWATRNLSMKGKLTIINTLLIPKIIYPATILGTPVKVINELKDLFKKFLWNWKTPKIKNDVLIRNIKYGGIKFPCIECKIQAWKSLWAIHALKNEEIDPLWVHIVSSMLPVELDLYYLLKTRPKLKDLKKYCPNLPEFYTKIVENWSSVKSVLITTIEQVKHECLWINNLIISNNTPLYNVQCLQNKLWFVKDLLTNNNEFKTLIQLNCDNNLNLNFLDYFKLRQCIPHKWKQLLDNRLKEDKSTELNFNKMKRFTTLKCITIYGLIIQQNHDLISIPKSHTYWIEKYNITDVYKFLEIIFTSIRITYIQALQYKIINRVFNCNYWLTKLKILNTDKCRFCDQSETIEHFFYECLETNNFWILLKNWWNRFDLFEISKFTEQDTILGTLYDTIYNTQLNCILLIAKSSINGNKANNKQPDIYSFLIQFKYFLKLEEQIHIKNKELCKFDLKWGKIYDNI
jgi:hypothetical protein